MHKGFDVSIESATIAYRNANRPAISCVSISIGSGEVVCVVGPSGCGKSSLLRAIAGFTPLDSGRIVAGGLETSNARTDVGFVFQGLALFPHLRVRQQIEVGLTGLDADVVHDRVEEAIVQYGLEELKGRYPGELSRGQQQRLAMARTMAPWPRLVLADEPFSSVDALSRLSLQETFIAAIESMKVTACIVSHDVEECVLFGDKVVVLSSGPGTVVGVEQVQLPRPRTQRSRSTPEFIASRDRILWLLGIGKDL